MAAVTAKPMEGPFLFDYIHPSIYSASARVWRISASYSLPGNTKLLPCGDVMLLLFSLNWSSQWELSSLKSCRRLCCLNVTLLACTSGRGWLGSRVSVLLGLAQCVWKVLVLDNLWSMSAKKCSEMLHCERKKKETKKTKNSLWELGNQSGIQYLTHIIRTGLRCNHIISPTYTDSVQPLSLFSTHSSQTGSSQKPLIKTVRLNPFEWALISMSIMRSHFLCSKIHQITSLPWLELQIKNRSSSYCAIPTSKSNSAKWIIH